MEYDYGYEDRLVNIENDVQDRNSEAWHKLCEYIEIVAKEEREEFAPFEFLGNELYGQILTLPESISKLKKVKKIWLYGSSLKRIPPEIGEMSALEYFDPYTSYNLHWFPYEIVNCKGIIDSRVSTRALYGNYKHRRPFPDLKNNPVRYYGTHVNCSICKKEMTWGDTNQLWISLKVGTDVLPLLANLCSKECESKLPNPPKGYVSYPHKGGVELVQPTYQDWEDIYVTKVNMEKIEQQEKVENKQPQFLKLIRKIWEK